MTERELVEKYFPLARAPDQAGTRVAPSAEDNAGTELTYDGIRAVSEPYVVHGRLEATIAQVNNGDSCTVTVWIE